MASEKFCLRWNDFESNVSVAFRELREEKDFFDVTLACDDNQVQAHKVILSACSPFFRNILRRNPHQHPLLYLKGVKYQELLSVLNFMYQGEVNVAQEELNSFLAVAEDLRVKGLTQSNQSNKSESSALRDRVREREPPERDPVPPPKKPRPPTLAPKPPAAAPTISHQPYNPVHYDDDIQEVAPVKSEPRECVAPATPHQESSSLYESEQTQGENTVALDDESYAEYGDGAYDDGQYGEGFDSSYYDPGTGQPVGGDGNKGDSDVIETMVMGKLTRTQDGGYGCTDCEYTSKHLNCVKIHIESKHINTGGLYCRECGKNVPTRNALKVHRQRNHTQPALPAVGHSQPFL